MHGYQIMENLTNTEGRLVSLFKANNLLRATFSGEMILFISKAEILASVVVTRFIPKSKHLNLSGPNILSCLQAPILPKLTTLILETFDP